MAGVGGTLGGRRRPTSLVRVVTATLLLTVAGVIAAAVPAAAHAELVSSTPADGVTLAAAPARVVLEMSESVELSATRVAITDVAGHDVPVTSLRLRATPGADTEQPTALLVGLPHLGVGQYRVSWHTLSSDDLHVTQGVMVFGVGEQVRGSRQQSTEPAPSWLESGVRWAGLLGLGVMFGCFALLFLLGSQPENPSLRGRLHHRLLSGATAAGLLAALLGAALPLVQARAAGGAVAATLRATLLVGPRAWRWWVLELATLLLVAIAMRYRGRVGRGGPIGRSRSAVAAVVIAAGAASAAVALRGHTGARAGAHPVIVVAESVHVLAALTWAGAVVAAGLVLSIRTGEVGRVRALLLRRFGFLAAGCVAVAALTGSYLAGYRITTLDALVHSGYGRELLVKLSLLLVAGLLGLTNTVLLRPTLSRRILHRAPTERTLTRTVLAEGLLVVLALGAAATLASSAPATGTRWQPSRSGPAAQGGQADDLVETFRVQPNRPGRNFIAVETFDTRRPSPGEVRTLTVRLAGPGQRVTRIATRSGDGSWVVAGQELPPGRWVARVRATRPGLPDATTTYRWVVPDPAAREVRGAAATSVRSWSGPAAGVAAVALLLAAALLVGLRRRPSRAAGADRPREAVETVGAGRPPGSP